MNTTTKPTTRPACIADHLPEVGAYFACLAAYNAGHLHGAWVDLWNTSADEIREAIDWILSTSPEPGAEEWAMHDSSGLPGWLSRTEWPEIEELARYGETVAELGDDDAEAYRLCCEDRGEIVDEETFREAYQGLWDTQEEFCQQLAEDTGAIADDARWPLVHIDWSAAWVGLECDGYSAEPAGCGGVHIFRAV